MKSLFHENFYTWKEKIEKERTKQTNFFVKSFSRKKQKKTYNKRKYMKSPPEDLSEQNDDGEDLIDVKDHAKKER